MVTKNGGAKLPFHEDEIMCIALHPTRPLVLSGDSAGCVFGAHYASGEISGRIGKHKDGCESVALSDELQMGVSCSIDSEILIYDLKGLTIRHRVMPTFFGGFTKVAFSTILIKDKEG